MKKIFRGSGNVFTDIGTVYPERTLARAEIMSRIAEIIKERQLTQKEASGLLGIPQSKISCLVNGKLSMFSIDLLFVLLNKLDRDIDIVIKPKMKHEGAGSTHVLLTA